MGKYDESSIKVLQDTEHVRLRPLMYLSSERPLYQIFTEVLDNSVDELMNGYGNSLNVSVDYEKNEFTIEDNGRGIPQGMNETLNQPTPVIIYTKLNSGGKYDSKSYIVAGGLHGVGGVVVNSLSESLYVETYRDSSMTSIKFCRGELLDYKKETTQKKGSGTKLICKPDLSHKIFKDTLLDYQDDIQNRLSLLKTLLPKVHFYYNNVEISPADFATFIPTMKEPLLAEPIVLEKKNLRIALNWAQETNKCTSNAYCNSIYNPNGGDHEKGIYDAISELLGNSDFTLGLNLAVSTMYPGVEYDSQAKLRAVSKDMRQFVKENCYSLLKSYLKNDPEVQKSIEALIKTKRNAIDHRNNKSNIKRNRRSTFMSNLGVSGFSDCTTKNREDAELYIVEGNSAAGSAIQARSVETQAILPIRGKIINAINSDIASLFKNAEVSQIMSSINTGTFEEVDISKSRYGKVIIFADADPDGKNISVLLLALFTTMVPELVDAGMLYLALPPLYGTHVKGRWIPINDEETKDEYMAEGYEIQRYKGLGEMNPEQLRTSCMNPDTRNMLQIKTTEDCYEMIKKIAGGSAKYRKELLKESGVLVD